MTEPATHIHRGLHATLAGVILAAVTPTRPPPILQALMAQAETVIEYELRRAEERVLRHGPSEPTLRALDAIHDRIESPASKLLRSVEPWLSYFVLPLFALANAGLDWSATVLTEHGRLIGAIVLGLVLGKPIGMLIFATVAVRLGIAFKPEEYSWRQLIGAGALAGVGFHDVALHCGQGISPGIGFRRREDRDFPCLIARGGNWDGMVLWSAAGSRSGKSDPAK